MPNIFIIKIIVGGEVFILRSVCMYVNKKANTLETPCNIKYFLRICFHISNHMK